MQGKDIIEKIKARRYHLNRVVANNIDKDPDDLAINIKRDTICSILENTKDYLSIKVNIKIFLEPEALFSIEMEYIIEFKLEDKMTDKDIEDNISTLISPLAQESSYLAASLTKEIIGTLIILPPDLEVSEVKK